MRLSSFKVDTDFVVVVSEYVRVVFNHVPVLPWIFARALTRGHAQELVLVLVRLVFVSNFAPAGLLVF